MPLPQVWLSQHGDPPTPGAFTEPNIEHSWVKPYGGMWTSTATPFSGYLSGWHEWCSIESFGLTDEWWLLFPPPNANLFVVDSVADLVELLRKFPDTSTPANSSRKPNPDWIEAAAVYDGVRLTEQGEWQTRMSVPPNPNLYGWDSESTLWFRWTFEEIEGPFPVLPSDEDRF